jgi:RecB family exonuclease
MTKIRCLFGKTVSARQKLLHEMMESSSGLGFLHIVPTKGRVMELETDPLFWIRRRVNTITGVIHKVFEDDIRSEKYPDHFIIDRMVAELLIRKAITEKARGSHGLNYFNTLFHSDQNNREFTGICRNILSFISTLYKNNYEDIYANDLGKKIFLQDEKRPGSSDEKYALEEDLMWLMGDYEELKRRIRGYDSDDICKDVRDFLRTKKRPSCMADQNIIILDSLTHITRIEEEIIFHLIEGSDELWWLIDYDTSSDDPITEFKKACGSEAKRGKPKVKGESECCRAYYSLISLMERLQESLMPVSFIRADDVPYPNPYAGILYTNKGHNTKSECSSLKTGAFNTQVDEVAAIASKIKWILSGKGEEGVVRPGDIRVIFPDLTDYASIVSEIFTEYGLPFSLTKGIPLSSHPLSDIFIRIMELPLQGFKRNDLFSLFSSALITPDLMGFALPDFSYDTYSEDILLPGDTLEIPASLLNTETTEAIKIPDIHLFDMAMRRCGIERLGKRLENISDERLQLIKGQYLDKIAETISIEEKSSLKQEYYLFILQRLVFKSVLEPFVLLPDSETPEKIVEGYKKIIALLGFPVNILDINNRDSFFTADMKRGLLKRDVRAFTLLNKLLTASQRDAKLAQRLFNIEKGEIMLASFLRTFRNRIKNEYLHDERNPDVIRVSQMLEIRGRSFDYLFVGGLTSGRFPDRERPDFIIPEASRSIFRIIDPVDQAKQLVSSILKNYNHALFLSYPKTIAEKPVQPSQVIQDLCALISDDNTSAQNSLSWVPATAYTSPNDLLNASRLKTGAHENKTTTGLSNIIIRDSSGAEDIIRGIKSTTSRASENGLFEYDGMTQEALSFMDFLKGHGRVYSSSSLETLANCPMRYLFRYIYNMKDPDEILADSTLRDMGSFTHDILSVFFRKLAMLNTNIYNMGIKKAFTLAKQIMENSSDNRPDMERIDFTDFYKQELFAGIDPEKKEGIRQGIIASLLLYENDEFKNRVPEGVEYEFGKGIEVKLGNIHVKGYIDRFDRNTDSPDRVYIYDYKTGYIKPSLHIKKGLAFQLPIYLRALQSMQNTARISASYYSLKRESFFEKDVLKQEVCINSQSGGIDLSGVTLIDEYTTGLTRLVEKGIFHHSADGLTCEYCTYRYACHKNERRMDFLVDAYPDLEIYSGANNYLKWQQVDEFRKEWKGIRQSMEKAETLKTPSARKRHIDAVIKFRNDLNQRGNGLPFTTEYMDSLIEELDRFLYRNNKPNAEE